MSVISKVKQNIRAYLTTKYDALYLEELDSQVNPYDDWVWEQNNSEQNPEEELILDLGKEETKRREKRQLATKISFSEITSFEALEKITKLPSDSSFVEKSPVGKGTLVEDLIDRNIVILAEETDRVTPDALDWILEVFENNPQIEILYTDEDEVNHEETVRMNPWLKPDYSPDTLLSYFYFGKLIAMRSGIFQDALSKVKKNENSKKYLYALMLEACSSLDRTRIYHLKKVLYSSHNITPWGWEEEYKEIRQLYNGLREREEAKGVSIIIPSKDNPEVLDRCLASIEKWTKDVSYEIIVVDNGSNQENKKEIETMQSKYGFIYLYEPQVFNFSRMCNQGVAVAKHELLLFLNDDCEVRGSKWLSHMASLATVKNTGAVGAKLYYPNSKKIQHCGIYNIHLGPVHKLQFKEDTRPFYDRRNLDVRNVLAVTAA